MSRRIRLRLDVSVPRTWLAGTLAAALLLTAASELGSENVTMSTYYPAPSGVYTQMLTTQNTFLARDGGRVGIGTGSPTQKLDVAGKLRINDGTQAAGLVLTSDANGVASWGYATYAP